MFFFIVSFKMFGLRRSLFLCYLTLLLVYFRSATACEEINGCNTCRCKYKKCERKTGNCEGCAIGYKSPPGKGNCQMLDIAFNKKTMGTVYTVGEWKSSNVVDGKIITNLITNRSDSQRMCFHSKVTNTPSNHLWQVDFGFVTAVKWLTLINRMECCYERMSKFQIYLSNTTISTKTTILPKKVSLCYTHTIIDKNKKLKSVDDVTYNITCGHVTVGRYLIVFLRRQKTMNFCQLTVLQCADNSYGKNCEHKCTCADAKEECNKITGECRSGCPDGYTGQGCKKGCPVGRYGQGCKMMCRCYSKSACRKTDGVCGISSQGYYCKPGYYIKPNVVPNCLHLCPENRFGPDCKQTCHCKNAKCQIKTGNCDRNICADGWRSENKTSNCQKPCPDGKYGSNCKNVCACHNEPCNKVSGECKYTGCRAGRTGDDCQTDCENGYFGQNCTQRCEWCKESVETCNKITGVCIKGCKDGGSIIDCRSNFKKSSQVEDNKTPEILPVYAWVLIAIAAVAVITITGVTAACIKKRRHKRVYRNPSITETRSPASPAVTYENTSLKVKPPVTGNHVITDATYENVISNVSNNTNGTLHRTTSSQSDNDCYCSPYEAQADNIRNIGLEQIYENPDLNPVYIEPVATTETSPNLRNNLHVKIDNDNVYEGYADNHCPSPTYTKLDPRQL